MKNNIDNYPENSIKSYLKIENPKILDEPFYKINSQKNIITLFHPTNKKPSDRSSEFELDKIFTSENENSYIYEEICLNTIKDCLDGFSFSFIAYGETSSRKVEVTIGDFNDNINNINHRGIYPRLLENLLNKINNNETKENKFNLSMSFFMVNGNNLVDFSALKDIKNNYITRDNLFNKNYIIKNETDIIKNISKIKVENTEENLSYINKILTFLSNHEKNTKERIYSNSHICLVLYLTNKLSNKIIKSSTISFIILNGSEYLYSKSSKKLLSPEKAQNNNNINRLKVDGAKITLETQFTFETVYNCIKSVKCLNNELSKNNIKINNKKENLLFSQLTTVIYNICFGDDIKKIKYRIIGTIFPNTGYYKTVKDTILFLYECRNIFKRKKNLSQNMDSLYDSPNDVVETKKDDYIFQLENKVKNQKKRIDELSKNLEKKETKINFLQDTYIAQINTVKKKLNFPGDINVLISGDENTKEANFVKEMREYQDSIKRNEGNIHILEKKLKEANDEIIKLKNKNIVKNSDETMVNYYLALRQAEDNRNKEDKSLRMLYNQIEGLKKEIKAKDQINSELKKEIQNKNNILFNLPLALRENYTLNQDIIKNKEGSIKSDKDSENKNENDNLSENKKKTSESEILDNDAYYGEKIRQVKEENLKNLDNLQRKYESIIEGKNKENEEMKINIQKANEYNKNEFLSWKKELMKYNEKFMKLISNYKRIFFSKFAPQYSIVTLKNKKEEFDDILLESEKEINHFNFPKLFQELESKNKLSMAVTGSITNMRKTLHNKKIKKNIILKEDKKSNENLQNMKLSVPPPPIPQVKNTVDEITNNGKIVFNKERLEAMSKEALIIHCLNLNKKVDEIENYLEKYAQYKKGFNVEAFENNINYKENTISELNEKINKLTNTLDEQIQVNYNNMNVINTQNRIIEKFQKEKFLNSILGKNRNKNYNATINQNMYSNNMLINENSTYSTLIHSIKNNTNNLIIGKKLKKSNSCFNINDMGEQVENKKDSNPYFSYDKITKKYINKEINKTSISSRKIRPFSSNRGMKKEEEYCNNINNNNYFN